VERKSGARQLCVVAAELAVAFGRWWNGSLAAPPRPELRASRSRDRGIGAGVVAADRPKRSAV